jgi:hypothetical protein
MQQVAFWTTLGYAAAGSDQRLAYFMSKPRTLLIDLRKDPHSEYAMWEGSALRRAWGKRYRQAGAYLGNDNHANDGPISIPRLQEGLETLLRYIIEGWNLVLLCGCMNFCECHRSAIHDCFAQILRISGIDVPYIVEDTPEPGMINCLSIKQPWAEIICRAYLFRALDQIPKEIENRSWMTPWRGRFAIHASSTFDTGIFKNKAIDPTWWQDRFGVLSASVIPVHKDQYSLGAIIGTADLVDVVTSSNSPWFVPGQYGLVLANIQPIDPIPWRGQRRLFQIDEQIISGRQVAAA